MSPEIQEWSHKSRFRINNFYLLTRPILPKSINQSINQSIYLSRNRYTLDRTPSQCCLFTGDYVTMFAVIADVRGQFHDHFCSRTFPRLWTSLKINEQAKTEVANSGSWSCSHSETSICGAAIWITHQWWRWPLQSVCSASDGRSFTVPCPEAISVRRAADAALVCRRNISNTNRRKHHKIMKFVRGQLNPGPRGTIVPQGNFPTPYPCDKGWEN